MHTMIEVHTIRLAEGIHLTTRRNESSDGIPVLVVDGSSFSCVGVTARGPAENIVRRWAARPERSSAERAFAALFLVGRRNSWSRMPLMSRLIDAGL
ncbi:MAG: hypothetical protein LAO51_18825 [Acidobacteriia bacterium]|nr:hypothetical protein [Terriglobia bacterium]